jgi:hypothetical protein
MAELSEDKYLVGRVRVPLPSITFQDEVEARLFDIPIVENPIKLFAKGRRCKKDKLQNHISAIISPIELDVILYTSGLTRDDLRDSLVVGVYPTVSTLSKIYCLNGRHRIEAAKDLPAHESLWTVALYSFETDRNVCSSIFISNS